MPEVIISQHALQFTDTGDGEIILFLHGWGDSKETFSRLIAELSDSYRCISLDLPAFGASEPNENCVTVEQYAQVVAAFVEKQRITKFSLVGHSMGGQIAAFAVARKIIKPEKMVLIAAAGVRDEHRVRKGFSKAFAKTIGKLTPASIKDDMYNRIGSDYRTSLAPIHKQIITNVLAQDVINEAAQIAIPALLIFGERDTSTPPAHGSVFHDAISQSELHVMEGADHWLHQTSSREIAKIMKDFL